MAYLFKKLVEPYGMSFGADRDPTRQEWMPWRTSDRDSPIEDWMRAYYPKALFVDEKYSLLNHWGMGLGGMYCVSAQVKSLIEQLEPDVHQFLAVDLHRASRKYQYYILKFGQTMDCVDAERSPVSWETTKVKGRAVKYWMPEPGKPLLVQQRSIAGAHLWQTENVPDLKFMSNQIHDLLKANDALTGLECSRQQEI